MNQSENNYRLGITAALGAFSLWGLAPIYFKWVSAVPPLEVIAHRILWAIPVLAGFLWLRDGNAFWRRMLLPRRSIMTLVVTGCLIAGNWWLFVWAVSNDQILATSLGYFINPLISVLLGFVFLHEKLTRIQVAAVAIAAAGTVYLGWFLGVAPWISLTLAISFGLYGLVRKKLNVGPMIGLLWETLLLVIPAAIYMLWGHDQSNLAFGSFGLRLDVLLALAGLVTVVPLVWFNVAARSMPLSAVGFFQYLAPTITFLLAVYAYHEPFTQGHAVAFVCIWFALAMVSVESLVRQRRTRRSLQ